MSNYQILMHAETLAKVSAYRQALAQVGKSLAGGRLQVRLSGDDLASMSDAEFLERLFATKPPLIFAESTVYGDGRDWNQNELSILGDIGVAVPVLAFDDGRHRDPAIHTTRLPTTLLFIPGALLRNGMGNPPADWAEVTRDGKIDPGAYQALYARRLLPLLLYANEQASKARRKAFITIPGLGCGQFAGPFMGQLGDHLGTALRKMLETNTDRMPWIRAVYYDPYGECRNGRHDIGGLSLLVRPLLQGNEGKPQLCHPAHYAETGDDFDDCLLFSVVAWDHVSWPGNDFYGGSRCTDDGVKAAATDLMLRLTGIAGHYDPTLYSYQPPTPYRNWAELVQDRTLTLRVEGKLQIWDPDVMMIR
jgi:hypothetical protein